MATPATTETKLYDCPICIGGDWRPSAGRRETLLNPATAEPVTTVPYCTPEEVRAAVDAAQAAFDTWRQVPVVERAHVFFRYRELLLKHSEEIARLTTLEHGKTLEESRASLGRGIEAVEFATSVPTLLMGDTVGDISRGVDTVTVRQPLGVCVGIPPFNFPSMVPLWMYPLAIACGNTFVMKPSERVPRTVVRLIELLYEAGLPKGVCNVVHGTKDVVEALLDDPRVKAVSFVGSSPVARSIYETAGRKGKRVQAMGGAKNHLVIMPGCDLPAAVKAILGAAYGCTGQRCLATSVVIAVGGVADPLVEELKKAAGQISVGSGDNPKTGMGPVVNAAAKQRIENYIQSGQQEGARLVADGRAVRTHDGTHGFYVGPTIFDHARPEMRIAREEIFGPVLAVIRAKDLDDAIGVVNGSEFGNATSIFTGSGAEGREFAARAQAGMVGVNVGVPAPSAFFPFAGWKGSFFGDLHALGRDAVRFYTETKVVTSRWPTPAREHKISF
ncbi:MAG TPA: CoA-acylating methylmalonate-semialdehyde dehydrogenase [Candidatus Acidoferrales bacterium]|nr:CoA-acylating methylmalonate-semialdehyde dehydrogenase [Candidatus Acidoferrales bacterium]